ncbi:unnamed protein product [Timema podura]|uniref:RING-type domain-containing protein n=1 Tax=Timema podura TaxID=61482 RepID=A0ABN7P855_TIMPD|nr:unnamed protein product [Timema podura]
MERFYDGDQDQLFSEARVINPFRKPTIINRSAVKMQRRASTTGTEECEICFMVLRSSMMTGLECGHRFCTQCWGEYLTTKIMEEGVGQTIACAAHGCNILVDDATVMRLVRDSKVKLKYQHLITNSFVELVLLPSVGWPSARPPWLTMKGGGGERMSNKRKTICRGGVHGEGEK